MTAEELLKKIEKLNVIYESIRCDIEWECAHISVKVYVIWGKRKSKILLSLINQFKKETLKDIQ